MNQICGVRAWVVAVDNEGADSLMEVAEAFSFLLFGCKYFRSGNRRRLWDDDQFLDCLQDIL